MMDYETTYRIVRPEAPRARSRLDQVEDSPEEREARILAWERYYESGPGFEEAVWEAWNLVVRRQFTRCSFQDAAQHVGWTTRRLIWAFQRKGYNLPEHLNRWASRHVERYLAENYDAKPRRRRR